jgi:ATP-binding cassette, sub-family E, member 1
MRIAIVHKDRCHSRKCGTECRLYCPRVRTGDETVVMGPDGKAEISEELCVGCGICIKKCPFDAIDIVSLPEELEHPTHRYGRNGFALYGLPIPVEGKVTGILGANGIGRARPSRSCPASSGPTWARSMRRLHGKRFSSCMPAPSCSTISRPYRRRN